jgi:exosortase E/protease (VPEID-CTERM system)
VVSVVLADTTLMTLENQPTTGQRLFRTTLRSWYGLFLFILLVLEILLLTPPFDTSIDLAGSGRGRLLFTIQHALRPTITTAAMAFIFLNWPRLRNELGDLVEAPGDRKTAARWLMLHCGLLVPLILGSMAKRPGRIHSLLNGETSLFGWIIFGSAALAALGLAALPLRFWRKILASSRVKLLGSIAIGAGTYVLGYWAESLWGVLQRGTLDLVVLLLRSVLLTVDTNAAQQIVSTPSFAVQIAPACSGIEGMGLVGVFLAVYLWVYRKDLRFPQAYVLFPVGMLTIWLLNAIRIALLILIGGWAPETAVKGFHSVAGWLFFNAAVCGLAAASWRFKFFRLSPDPDYSDGKQKRLVP